MPTPWVKTLRYTLRDPLHSFVRIGSLEGLRSRQLDEDDEVHTPRQRLMRQLQDHPASDVSLFDLVIVDEAHAARNAETVQDAQGRDRGHPNVLGAG